MFSAGTGANDSASWHQSRTSRRVGASRRCEAKTPATVRGRYKGGAARVTAQAWVKRGALTRGLVHWAAPARAGYDSGVASSRDFKWNSDRGRKSTARNGCATMTKAGSPGRVEQVFLKEVDDAMFHGLVLVKEDYIFTAGARGAEAQRKSTPCVGAKSPTS